jgi:hypothetical protein
VNDSETGIGDGSQSPPVDVLFPLPPGAENVMKLDEETVNVNIRYEVV